MKNKIFNFVSYLTDIIANLDKMDYRIWVIAALAIVTIFLLALVIIWISRQPKRDKIQINPIKDGTSSFGGVNQGRRFKFSENVAAAYQAPTSKEELDFIVASHSAPESLNLSRASYDDQRPPVVAVNPQLARYIEEARSFGMTDQAITQELKKVGWKEPDITRHLTI